MEDVVGRLTEGLAAGTQPQALLLIAAGIVIGIFVGAAPGIGPTVGMSVMLPVAVRLSPEHAIFMLASINVGAVYGNSIPAILMKVPGTPSALLTVIEGHPLHQRGEGGRALLVSLVSSVVGQLLGVLIFIAFVIPLAEVAIRLLFPEVFAVVLFGIVTATGLVTRSPWKGVAAIALGLILALPGQDAITGQVRFAFGTDYLSTGLPLVPVVVGLLAFREVFLTTERGAGRGVSKAMAPAALRLQRWLPGRDWRAVAWPMAVGAVVGLLIGIVPGAGSAVASFVAYQVIKLFHAREPDFGRGSVRGLATIDASKNSATAGELIPTLALGIPGASTMVVIMAALSAQGIFPGPQLVQSRPDLLYATFGGLLVGVLALSVIGYLSIFPSVYVSTLSQAATMGVTMVLVVTGAFALRWRIIDVWVAVGAGLLGYLMNRYEYPVAPTALAFILGGLLETNLRRGLVMTGGIAEFVTRPVTAALLVVAAIAFAGGIVMNRRIARSEDRADTIIT